MVHSTALTIGGVYAPAVVKQRVKHDVGPARRRQLDLGRGGYRIRWERLLLMAGRDHVGSAIGKSDNIEAEESVDGQRMGRHEVLERQVAVICPLVVPVSMRRID